MSTIPIEISTEQLLRAVERLPANELETFVAQVIALRTRREGGQLDANETALLLTINAAYLDPAQQARFDALVAKRQAETITPTELQELIAMTDVIEQRDTERLEALQELARVRQTTVGILMDALGIRTPAYG
ncbi:STAS/SEC14 domain-containing protein [Candidatus Chloroploca sp. Khr17]|uniref:STAS/SEC14 domain-containing protein n=1 Tax=Candidatus Chloroploca sp. Khr17 TaxID=2496869 RepID=UPI00101B968F|nr:STAS/SEC14 domain-containing protein [Candidatus Chloroploca sp. Khr17]